MFLKVTVVASHGTRLSRLLLGDGNIESTISEGGVLRGYDKEGKSIEFIESNLLSTTGVGSWGVGPGRLFYPLIA